MSTSAYTAERDKFGRQVQWLVEIDYPRCQEVYTVNPCSATDQGNGSRCFYSYLTCQDLSNFNPATETLYFCLNDVPWPDSSVKVWPLLEKIVTTPQSVEPSKLRVFPDELEITMLRDFLPPVPDSDRGVLEATTIAAGGHSGSPNWNNPANAYDSDDGTYSDAQNTGSDEEIIFTTFGAGTLTRARVRVLCKKGSGQTCDIYYSLNSGTDWIFIGSGTAVKGDVDSGTLYNVDRSTFQIKVIGSSGALGAQITFVYEAELIEIDHAYNSTAVGEFWSNFVARFRNYVGQPIRFLRGFAASGFTLSDFDQVGPDYRISGIEVNGNQAVIKAISPLADLDTKVVPWAISEDNTIQDSGGINASVTSVTVVDATEYPDPASYTRNAIYVRMESEICEVTAINTGTNVLTIVRGSLNTTAATHAAGVKVEHVAFFGIDNGVSTDPTGDQVGEVVQDLLEWADIATADIDTTTFDDITTRVWSGYDMYRLITKSERISKLLAPIRKVRAIMVYIDSSGKWAGRAIAAEDPDYTLTDDNIVEGTLAIEEDQTERATRVSLWYDPNVENPGDEPRDYDKGVLVIDTDLEAATLFGEVKERRFADPWMYPSVSSVRARSICARFLSRYRFGVRTITFQVELINSAIAVGDSISLSTDQILDARGNNASVFGVVIARKEIARSRVELKIIDTTYNGRYMRIGPDTMAGTYDSASASDKTYGYWGDTNNRVGSTADEGYLIF